VGTDQVHDYNPGIASNGLFWTMPIAPDAIDANPGKGRASLVAHDLAVPDYHDFVNSLLGAGSVPAVVSFDVRWHDIQSRRNRNEPDFGFAGEFVVTGASIEWSARQTGFSFQSDPASTSSTVYAIVGHERNGVFFD
jgi:hypothetical protein